MATPDSIRCQILTGLEAAFAAGADITEMASASATEVTAGNVQQYSTAISECRKPVIAPIEGYARGGIRIAADR